MLKNDVGCTVILCVGLLFALSSTEGLTSGDCVGMDFGHGSVVCMCNSTYCDMLGPTETAPAGQYLVYTSSKDGARFLKEQFYFAQNGTGFINTTITINHDRKFQTVLGFGGAFTDAAGININSLSQTCGENLLRGYFSNDGLEYTLGRVPIGGADFSTRTYTYDDGAEDDFDLTRFRLAPEDFDYKIPLIHRASAMAPRPIKLLASAWSAPTWMKTSGDFIGNGTLKGEPGGQYYQTWAEYYVRFLDEYAKQNVTFWGVTSQNEPVDGLRPFFSFNCMGFTAETLGEFIGANLGPTLRSSGYEDVQLLMFDDQRAFMKNWTQHILANDSPAAQYVSGIAYHWYMNFLTSPEVLTETHDTFPDKFILSTEACTGAGPLPGVHVLLGNWERAEEYALDIIEDLNHWVVGWVDWNLALDQQGGPNWAGNFVDSAIIVDADNDQYYKQPLFYALGHFSKFLPPGSRILETVGDDKIGDELLFVAAETPENSTVLVILNMSDESRMLSIEDSDFESFFMTEIPANAIQTYLWGPQ